MVVTPWGDSESLRDRRLQPGPGSPPADVAKSQRERLFGAMVASVAERGYEATRVADLVELSGVSSRSFYDLFGTKEACFLATLEAVLEATVASLVKADDPAADWEQRLRQTYDAFASMLIAQPATATFCLNEAYAAGAAARAPLDRAVADFEQLSRKRLAESPDRAGIPAEMITAQIGALQEVARTRLRNGAPEEVAALVPDLVALMLSYRPPPVPLRLATRAPAFGPESAAAHDDAERALRGFALAIAEHGYVGATIHEIARQGSMSPSTFYANFRDKQDAMLAAIESATAQMTTAAMTAFHRSPEWATGVRAAIGSMLNFLASRPAMAHLLAVEVFTAGSGAIGRRAEAAKPLAALLAEGYLVEPAVPAVAGEAIAGGISALVRRRLLEGGPETLPGLAPICTYIALAPFIGADLATKAANGDGRGRLPVGVEPQLYKPAAQAAKWSALTVVALRRRISTQALAEDLDLPLDELTRYMEEFARDGLIERVDSGCADGTAEWVFSHDNRFFEIEDWESLSAEERERLNVDWLEKFSADISEAISGHTFSRRLDNHVSRIKFTVDEQGWEELASIHRSALYATWQIQFRSLKRMRESGDPGIPGRSAQLLFEMPESDSGLTPPPAEDVET
jgi:AcrR family transcriptional regulator